MSGRLSPLQEERSSNCFASGGSSKGGEHKQPHAPPQQAALDTAAASSIRKGHSNDCKPVVPAPHLQEQQQQQQRSPSPSPSASPRGRLLCGGSPSGSSPNDSSPDRRTSVASMRSSSQLRATESFQRGGGPAARQQQQHQQQLIEDDEQDASAQQQRLQQLLGPEWLSRLEARMGTRILALPFAVARAADGSLFEVATGHVQLMMLRRHLAALGVDLTPEEEAALTAEADTGSDMRSLGPQSRQHRLGCLLSSSSAHGSITSQSGSCTDGAAGGTPPFGARRSMQQLQPSASDVSSLSWAAAAGSRGRKSVLRTPGCYGGGKRVSMLGGGRRSAIRAVLEAHAAQDAAEDALRQMPLDDVVQAHVAQLDSFVEGLKSQLAAAAAAKAAARDAATAVPASAAAASGGRPGGRPRQHSASQHRQQRDQPAEDQQQQQQQQDEMGPAAGHRGSVRSVVQHQSTTSSWQQHRTSAGSAVYARGCAEMGVTPCSQVLRELDSPTANLAHCKIGPAGAPPLAAALAATCTIRLLCLRGSGLDGRSAGVILAALAAATASRMTASKRARSTGLATTAAGGISAARQAAGLPPATAAAAAATCSSAATVQDQQRSQQRAKSMSVRFSPLALDDDSDGDDGAAASGSNSSGGGSSIIRPGLAGSSTTPASPADHVAGVAAASFFLPHSPLAGPAGSPHGATSSPDGCRTAAGSSRQQREPASFSCMSELDLGENQLGSSGAKAVAQLLDPAVHPSQFLVSLNLNKCALGEAGGLAIAAALRDNLKLRVLGLAHNQLRCKTAAALAEVLEAGHTLRELDLSWNEIKAEGACALARGLAANATLAKLELAWNGLDDAGGAAVGEALAANMGLKLLDLSHCRLAGEACLMLAEGLKSNGVLEVLLLSGNPSIGEAGARHLVVALAANQRLQFLGLQGANLTPGLGRGGAYSSSSGSSNGSHGGGGAMGGGSGVAAFNPAAPDGSYTLDLSVAAERVVAVQLAELDSASEDGNLMRGIRLDGKAVASARAADWPRMLPTRGELACTFAAGTARKRRSIDVMEPSKLAVLLRQLRMPSMTDRERLELLGVFAPLALFTCKQISTLVACFAIGAERVAAAALLFTRASDAASGLRGLTCTMGTHDLRGWHDALGWHETCRWNVPTGHYELNLALPLHAAIAARLRDEAQSSPEGAAWLNLLHDTCSGCVKQPEGHGPPPDWQAAIPTSGTASFDFVSTHPPGSRLPASGGTTKASTDVAGGSSSRQQPGSASGAASAATSSSTRSSATGSSSGSGSSAPARDGAQPLPDAAFRAFIKQHVGIQLPVSTDAAASDDAIGASSTSSLVDVAASDAALVALRQALASGPLLLSSQVLQLVEAFVVAVMCWPATLDRSQAFWTVLYGLQALEQASCMQRLGPANVFNVAHPSCHYLLDLSHPGHEQVARRLVALATGAWAGGGSGAKAAGGADGGRGEALPTWWNLRLRGVRKQVNENGNLWGMLTSESVTPILEVDFVGSDAWAAAGKRESDVAALPPGDQLELRAKLAARLEAVRCKQLYSYSCDGSAWQRQPWATHAALMSPQLDKAPWLAAWDRLVRVVVRLEARSGAVDPGSSSLQQVFDVAAVSRQLRRLALAAPLLPDAATPTKSTATTGLLPPVGGGGGAEEQLCITATELEALLRSWNCSKAEVAHCLQLMEARLMMAGAHTEAQQAAAAPGAGGSMQQPLVVHSRDAAESSSSSSSSSDASRGSSDGQPARPLSSAAVPGAPSAAQLEAFTRGLCFVEFVELVMMQQGPLLEQSRPRGGQQGAPLPGAAAAPAPAAGKRAAVASALRHASD